MVENRDVLSREATPPDATLQYGPDVDSVVDCWIAGIRDAPLVVLWHGGFWRAAYDRMHLRPLANALRDVGFTVATPEYRRTRDGHIGWPDSFDDVARVADRIPDLHASENVTPRVILHAGHSAGGHLAVWAARRHMLPVGSRWHLDKPLPIAGVLALAPVLDLAEAFRRDLDEGAVHALLGGSPEAFPSRYELCDPMRIGGQEPPVAILHGDSDGRVPIDLSRRYAAAGYGTLEEIPGADHFAVIDPESAAWPRVVRTLRRLASGMSVVDREEQQ